MTFFHACSPSHNTLIEATFNNNQQLLETIEGQLIISPQTIERFYNKITTNKQQWLVYTLHCWIRTLYKIVWKPHSQNTTRQEKISQTRIRTDDILQDTISIRRPTFRLTFRQTQNEQLTMRTESSNTGSRPRVLENQEHIYTRHKRRRTLPPEPSGEICGSP